MTGIVVISHSKKIADGIAEIAMQMSSSNQKIIPAGGTIAGGVGVSVEKVRQAVAAAYSSDGVLLLVDFGSAVLCAVKALQELGAPYNINSKIANAVLLEGTVAAAVQISLGGNLEAATEAAEEAGNMDKLAMSKVFAQ